jgi:nitroimidazol reductase NimA-like FMN-containing flavoprotein (pyridoxamine 5'-phosphate oxidase superfamily)
MDAAIKAKIQAVLDKNRIMTVATLRPDGWPQATTVGYVNDGFALYFLCGLDSQKGANIDRDDRVSVTINDDPDALMAITGISMAAHAVRVTDSAEGARVLALMPVKYPPQQDFPFAMPTPDQVRLYRLEPVVISVLDYSLGFGHTELVAC